MTTLTLLFATSIGLCNCDRSSPSSASALEHDKSLRIALFVGSPDIVPLTGLKLISANRLEPNNIDIAEGLRIYRTCIDYSAIKDGNNLLQPESEWYPGWLYSPALVIFGFFAWCIVCASLARWWQVRRRRWLIVAGIMLPLALIPPLNELVRYVRLEHDRAAPPVVISKDTVLRAGNGTDYASKINLPRCVECRKVGERGDWLQVEFASGLTGWVEKAHALVAFE